MFVQTYLLRIIAYYFFGVCRQRGFPETNPDHSTIWYFRERSAKAGKYKMEH